MYNNSTMDRQNGHHHKKSAVLYDAGGWFLMGMFFGVVFIGVVLGEFGETMFNATLL